MDGYTVSEAASVLGVPTERVWELLARGVLAGTPEPDGGMRVFLKGRLPEPIRAETEEARRPNGNSGPAAELSPFRELLTEFRNLTERYGQALLALGEARGEVASLRSRVDMLEARIDLRLPASPPSVSPAAAWRITGGEPVSSVPAPPPVAERPERAPESAARPPLEPPEAEPAEAEPAEVEHADSAAAPFVEDEEHDEAAPRRRRAHTPREAVAGLAEALARAEDPALADLPGGREAAAALAELQREIAGETAPAAPEMADLPVEAADEAAPIEPQPEVAPEPEVEPSVAEVIGPEEPSAEPAGIDLAPEPVAADVAEAEPMAEAEPEAGPQPMAEAEPGPVAEAEPEPMAEAEPEHPAAFAPSPYSSRVDEPDWFAEDDLTGQETIATPEPETGDFAAELEVATLGWREAAADEGAPASAEPVAPPRPPEPSLRDLIWPGGHPAVVPEPVPEAEPAALAEDDSPVMPRDTEPPSDAEPYRQPLAPRAADEGGSAPPAAGDRPWHAARAYRRLRRILPG